MKRCSSCFEGDQFGPIFLMKHSKIDPCLPAASSFRFHPTWDISGELLRQIVKELQFVSFVKTQFLGCFLSRRCGKNRLKSVSYGPLLEVQRQFCLHLLTLYFGLPLLQPHRVQTFSKFEDQWHCCADFAKSWSETKKVASWSQVNF